MADSDTDMEAEPIEVKIIGGKPEKEAAADWGSFQTYPLTPATPPQQILAFNRHRKNAYVIVNAGAGFVRVGTRAQVMNNAGGQMPTGQYKYEAMQELWASTDGTTATQSVISLDHRYE